MNIISIKYFIRRHWPVPVVFFVVVHLLYFKTRQAGFVTDFTGLQQRLDGAPLRDFLHSFGFPAMHQVTNFFLFIFYKIFGTGAWGWYGVYTLLHIANGFLGYILAKKIFEKEGLKATIVFRHHTVCVPALMAAGLFLVLPYNAEPVVWRVCFNFLFCTFTMLSSLLFLVKYLERGKKSSLVYSLLFFIVALFTFELALALPLMSAVFIWWWKEDKIKWEKILIIPGIHLLFVAFYFFLNKTMLGAWVGHYGADVHFNFDVRQIASNGLKYFFKNLLYWREWPHGDKESFLRFLDTSVAAYAFLSAGFVVIFYFILFYKKIKPSGRTAIFAWLLFFLALSPLLNLYVVWVLHGENDRYGYFASLFFYIGLVGLLQYFNKKIKYSIYGLLFLASVFYLNQINIYWKNSADIVRRLLATFQWEDCSEIYVLAFPDNYRGIPMFKDFSKKDLALKSALEYLAGKKTKGRFYQIAQFNMIGPDDGFIVEGRPGGVVNMQFNDWGHWWWRNGIGTGSYETEWYVFKTISKGCEIKIKKAAPDAVFIYSDGGRWKETPQRFFNISRFSDK
ncbi:MAG TPA: hypothetical protein ENJ20_08070 [Bacteroidetes bacterium]|nr:hypothetical protein [Bacteroidota bacterium]